MSQTFTASGTVAPGASVTKGLMAITANGGVTGRVIALDIFMDGGSGQFWPKFQLIRGTGSFTAPTGGTSLTFGGGNAGGTAFSANAVAKLGTFTAELAAGSGTLYTLKNWYVPNQGGISLAWPYNRDLEVGNGQIIYLQAITPASFANNIAVNAEWEE
jgi:hypothetical protein